MTSARSAGERSLDPADRAGRRRCRRRGRARRAASRPRRRARDARRSRGRRGPIERPSTSTRAPASAASRDGLADARSSRRRRASRAPTRCAVGRGSAGSSVGTTVRIWSIRSARTRSIRVVILRLTSSPATASDPRARDVAQDEAAVVGGGQVAGGRRGRVGLRRGRRPGRPAASGRAGSAPVGDLDDAVALDDDERVGARDDGVGGVGAARRDRLDRPAHDLDRHQRPDRVVDEHDVVVVGRRGCASPLRVLSLRVAPPATTVRRHRQRHAGRRAPACLVDPVGVRHDDEPIDARRGDGAQAAQQDRARRRAARTASASRAPNRSPSPPARRIAWIRIRNAPPRLEARPDAGRRTPVSSPPRRRAPRVHAGTRRRTALTPATGPASCAGPSRVPARPCAWSGSSSGSCSRPPAPGRRWSGNRAPTARRRSGATTTTSPRARSWVRWRRRVAGRGVRGPAPTAAGTPRGRATGLGRRPRWSSSTTTSSRST